MYLQRISFYPLKWQYFDMEFSTNSKWFEILWTFYTRGVCYDVVVIEYSLFFLEL